MPVADSDDEFGSADELMATLNVPILAACPPPRAPPARPAAASREAIVLDSDDEFGADNELDDLMTGIDERQLRPAERVRHSTAPSRTSTLFRPPTAAAQATGGQLDLHGNAADLRRKGVLSVQNASPGCGGKRWDKDYAAASGPLRNRMTMPARGDLHVDEDEGEVEDWDANRADHPLANVGLFGPGVRGTSSTSTSKLPDATFHKYLNSHTPQLDMAQQVDMHAAMTWIYPTNMPIRDYQFNIVQKALFKYVASLIASDVGRCVY